MVGATFSMAFAEDGILANNRRRRGSALADSLEGEAVGVLDTPLYSTLLVENYSLIDNLRAAVFTFCLALQE